MAVQSEIVEGCYRHYKGGTYEVIGMARHSETGEPLVVYRALYGAGELWVRPFSMFTETIDLGGQQVCRFEPIDDLSGNLLRA